MTLGLPPGAEAPGYSKAAPSGRSRGPGMRPPSPLPPPTVSLHPGGTPMPEAQDFDDISLEIRGLGGGRFETGFQAKGGWGGGRFGSRFRARGRGEVTGPFGMACDPQKIRPLLNVFHPGPYGFGPYA